MEYVWFELTTCLCLCFTKLCFFCFSHESFSQLESCHKQLLVEEVKIPKGLTTLRTPGIRQQWHSSDIDGCFLVSKNLCGTLYLDLVLIEPSREYYSPIWVRMEENGNIRVVISYRTTITCQSSSEKFITTEIVQTPKKHNKIRLCGAIVDKTIWLSLLEWEEWLQYDYSHLHDFLIFMESPVGTFNALVQTISIDAKSFVWGFVSSYISKSSTSCISRLKNIVWYYLN